MRCKYTFFSNHVLQPFRTKSLVKELSTTVPPFPRGGTFQDSRWMLETTVSTEPYIYSAFSDKYIPFHLKEALPGFPLAYPNGQH